MLAVKCGELCVAVVLTFVFEVAGTLFWKRSERKIDTIKKSLLESCDFLAQSEVILFLRTKFSTEALSKRFRSAFKRSDVFCKRYQKSSPSQCWETKSFFRRTRKFLALILLRSSPGQDFGQWVPILRQIIVLRCHRS